MRHRTGFTLKELIIVIVVLAVLVVGLVLTLRSRTVHRTGATCMANIKGIGNSMALYLAENNDSYPFISNVEGMNYDADMIDGGTDEVYDLDGVADGFGTALNINENLCLLNAKAGVPWKMFRCPAVSYDVMFRSEAGNHRYGFKDSAGNIYIDYAYHVGYTNTKDGLNAAPFQTAQGAVISGDFAILSDRPGPNRAEFGKGGNDGTGYSHGDEGVCVLYADGSARFSKETLMAGWGGNNIYTWDLPANSDTPDGCVQVATPVNSHDTVLIPPR